MDLLQLCTDAKSASRLAAKLGTNEKNEALLALAKNLVAASSDIIAANKVDVEEAVANGMSQALLDRLTLTEARIEGMAEGVTQVASLPDPIGEVLSMWTRPNGLKIGQQRVPLGVIGIIYESRPNVTVDSFALTFKSGNAVILRGGSDCIHSNLALVKVIKETLRQCGIEENIISILEDTDRKYVNELIRMDDYLDVIIPRGGAGLIRNVSQNASVPVIRTGTGNCHIYVDKDADMTKAVPIILNAKLQRLGVCNAAESLVIHKDVAEEALKAIIPALQAEGCEVRGDALVQEICANIVPATEEDYGTEYLAKIISVKVVDSIDQAIAHINKFSTGHSESIISENYTAVQQFLNEIDSAAVYANASTRFTDGFEFGFGAEIGISTQKLHARGPMGLNALTTTKYIIYGNGQVRP